VIRVLYPRGVGEARLAERSAEFGGYGFAQLVAIIDLAAEGVITAAERLDFLSGRRGRVMVDPPSRVDRNGIALWDRLGAKRGEFSL